MLSNNDEIEELLLDHGAKATHADRRR
jgi:hypothetical protein